MEGLPLWRTAYLSHLAVPAARQRLLVEVGGDAVEDLTRRFLLRHVVGEPLRVDRDAGGGRLEVRGQPAGEDFDGVTLLRRRIPDGRECGARKPRLRRGVLRREPAEVDEQVLSDVQRLFADALGDRLPRLQDDDDERARLTLLDAVPELAAGQELRRRDDLSLFRSRGSRTRSRKCP